MNNFFTKFGISGMALTIFLLIMTILSLYFFVSIDNKREELEKRGFRSLEKLGSGMKQKDRIYAIVVKNLAPLSIKSTDDTSRILPPTLGAIAESLKPHRKQDNNITDVLVYKGIHVNKTENDAAEVKGNKTGKKQGNR